jgi:hypothetical protein
MAFSLSKFRAYGLRTEGPIRKRAVQVLEFEIAATTADVALDIGDDGGTFWAAVDDTQLGADVKDTVFNRIVPQLASLLAVNSEQLLDRLQAAAASGTSYTLAVENHLPKITCAASNGEAAWVIQVLAQLNDRVEAVTCEYSGNET